MQAAVELDEVSRMTNVKKLIPLLALLGCVADEVDEVSQAIEATQPVGLSLWWENGAVRLLSGAVKTVDLYGDFERYIQELDITAQVVTATDRGIDPLLESGDMASLDWRGVAMTDEDWRPEGNPEGTYTRTRIFRGARWMTRASVFALIPVDEHGKVTGVPIIDLTGATTRSRRRMVGSCGGSWRGRSCRVVVR